MLLDALARHAPATFTRPDPIEVGWDGGTAWFATKATYCLKYHTKQSPDQSTGKGYCSTCPLVDPGCRVVRLAGKLARARSEED